MRPFHFVRWLRSLWRRPKGRTIEKKPRARLSVEELETRLAPASYLWTGGGGLNTNWNNPLNWSASVGAPSIPTAGAAIDLTFNNTAATFNPVNNIPGLTVAQLTVASGTYTISNTPGNGITLGNASTNIGTILVNTNAINTILSMDMTMGAAPNSSELIKVETGASLTLSGTISGDSTAQLSTQGSGTITVTRDNSAYLGAFKLDNTVGTGTVIISNARALGGPAITEAQQLNVTGATAGSTVVTLTYPGAATNPTAGFTFTGVAAADAANLQASLNALFNTLGFSGTPVAVAQTGGSGGNATYSITFGGTLAGLDVALLTAVAQGGGSASVTQLANPLFNSTTVTPGTQLQLNITAGGGGAINNPLILNGVGPSTTGALFNFAGNNNWVGNVQMSNAGSTNFTTLFINTGTTFTINGVLSGGNAVYTLSKEGAGTLALNPYHIGGNTYDATTQINNGIVSISHPFALGAAGTATNVNTNAFNRGSLFLNYLNSNFIAPQYLYYAQVQNLNFNNCIPGTTTYTLTYNGVTTPVLVYQGNANDATNIQSALNNVGMTSINGIGANVGVVPDGSGGVIITFGGSLGGLEIPTLTTSVTSAPGTGEVLVTTGIGTTPIGMQIPSVVLTLNGGGFSLGTMSNQAGHNHWAMPITLTGNSIHVQTSWNFTIDGNLIGPGFSKVGQGRLILPNQNSLTSSTFISSGIINVRDSNALGGFSPTISSGTSLELQADGKPDSSGLAGTYNLFFPAGSTLSLSGSGANGRGALYNVSGVNRIDANISLVGATSIGVDPDPDPYNIQGVTANNLSQLIVNGVISGSRLTKIGFGELVLNNANTFANGTGQNVYQLFINQGWVTAQHNQALGAVYPNLNPVDQPGVQVSPTAATGGYTNSGAALMLKQDLAGNNLNLPYAMSLSGFGIRHRYAWLNQLGALENLDGSNQVTGQIYLQGAAGVGVEIDGANSPYQNASQLIFTGAMYDGASAGQLVKLGTQKLILQGPGLYTGGVDIQKGVLRIHNDTALGAGTATADTTTNVKSGAALELGPTLPLSTGGIQRGLQVWYTKLVLNGTGNTDFGDAPLVVGSNDNLWRGPIVLNTNIAVTFKNNLGNRALPVIFADSSNLIGGGVTVDITTLGNSSFNEVQTLTFGAGITGGTFTLVIDDGAGNIGTAANIPWSPNLPVLIANILNALNALAPIFNPGNLLLPEIVSVATNSPIIDIYPNARLTATGTISDGVYPGSIAVNGGGELALSGTNTFRGTTFINQGTLTISAGQALGAAAPISELQTLTITGTPTFTLSFNGSAPSAPITYTNTTADLTNITNALNGLSTIGGLGGIAGVTQSGNTFRITLGGALAGFDQPAIVSSDPLNALITTLTDGAGGTVIADGAQIQMQGSINVANESIQLQGQGNPLQSEVQQFSVGGPISTTFRLTFTNPVTGTTSTTGDLPVSATASQVKAALDALPAIIEGNNTGGVGGSVQVGRNGQGLYTVLFQGTFTGLNLPNLVVSSSSQSLTFSGTTGTFTLEFTGFPGLLTGNIAPTANASTIENELNNLLATAGTPGYVSAASHGTASVAALLTGGGYLITFGGTLAGQTVPLLIATPSTGGSDDVIADVALTGMLTFSAEVTQGGTANATPNQWFNAGPSPVANAAVNLSAAAAKQNIAGPVTSIVSDPGDSKIIYIATAGGGAWKTTNGGITWAPLFDNMNTVQQVRVQGSDPTVDTFTLTYTDPVTTAQTTTVPLPFNATTDQIKAALDKIVGAGNSVTVNQQVNANGINEVQMIVLNTSTTTWTPNVTRFRLTFRGQRTSRITYTGNPATDALNIQTALNALSTIGGGANPGFVTVNATTAAPGLGSATDSAFTITFGGGLSAKDQPLITFTMGGGGFGGDNFWFPASTPSPFPTINLIPAVHNGGGGTTINFNGGSLNEITGGSGPAYINTVTFGGGSLAGVDIAPLTFTAQGATTVGEAIASVNVTAGGTGYTSNPSVSFTGGGGAGAAGYATISGSVTNVTIPPGGGGAGYTGTPNVVFVGGGGTGAAATAVVTGGVVTAINITSGGTGYTSAPTVLLVGGGQTAGFGNTATATATITGSVTGVILTNTGTGYTSLPTSVNFTGGGGSGAAGDAVLSMKVLQKGINSNIAMFGGIIAISPANPNVLYFGTGNANRASDSYYGTGIYKSTDAGQTWNLITDQSLANPNPLFGLSINTILFDPTNSNILYLATADSPANGLQGIAVKDQPTLRAPGIWRLDERTNTFFNLTNQVSVSRASVLSTQPQPPPPPLLPPPIAYPNPPQTPGPDDNYLLEFKQNNVAWTDIKITNNPNNGGVVLYAALGTATGTIAGTFPPATSPGPGNVNAVYWVKNPSGISSSTPPKWYVGQPGSKPTAPATIGPEIVDNRDPDSVSNVLTNTGGGQFPTPTYPKLAAGNGVIKIGVVAGGGAANPEANNILANDRVYASIANTGGSFSEFQVSTDSAQNWNALGANPGNYTNAEARYADALVMNGGTIFVAGSSSSGASYVWQFSGGAWTDITTQGGFSPHTHIHTLAIVGGQLTAGTDGGIWQLTGGVWTNITGNLATAQFNSITSDAANLNRILGGGVGMGTVLFNGTQSWIQTDGLQGQSLNGGPVAIDPNNPQIIYHVQNGTISSPTAVIYRTLNGGTTWAAAPGAPTGSSTMPLVIDSRSRVFTISGTVRMFDPQLATWTSLLGGGGAHIAVATRQGLFAADAGFPSVTDIGATNNDARTVYTASGTSINVTKNLGLTWVNRTITGATGSVADIQIDPSNRDTLWVLMSNNINSTSDVVWKTTDAGRTWSQLGTGLPSVPAWKLAYDSRTGDLYVGNDLGVYKLAAGTTTWQKFGVNLPNVAVHALDLNVSTNVLTAGSYGRSAWQFFLGSPSVQAGALRATGGSNIWGGPIVLTGPTTISTQGNQGLQNGLALSNLTVQGVISDLTGDAANNSLTKVGGGNLILASQNIYAGDTVLKQGNIIVQNPFALGDSGTPGVQDIILDGAIAGTTKFDLYFNGSQTSTQITYTGTSADATAIAAALNNTTDFPNIVPAGGTVSVVMLRPGAFQITFGGSLAGITKPLLNAIVDNTTPGTAYAFNAGGTAVNAGSVLQLNTSLNAEPLSLYGDGVSVNGHNSGALQNVNGANTYNGIATLMTNSTIGVELGSSLTIVSPGTITDLGGASGQFSLTKEARGTLTLTTDNTYVGNTFVNQGVLNLQHAGALGSASATTRVLDGAQLQLQHPTGGSITFDNQRLLLSGTGLAGTGALLNVNGTNTWTGDILLDSLPSFSPTTVPPNYVSFGANAGTTLTVDGVIDDPFSLSNQPGVPFTESENNGSAGTANGVTLPTNASLIISGAVGSSGDLDYYQFTLTQRSGVFFDIDSIETGLSTSLNSVLTLYQSNGTTVIDSNDNGYDFDTGYPAPTLASSTTADSALYRDLDPGTYYIRVSSTGGTSGTYSLIVRADTDYSNTIPALQSLPGAADTLYLDFDGHADTDFWNSGNPYNMPGFDFNGNINELTPGEKHAIRSIWRVVSEDYSPFNVNVSTVLAGATVDGASHRMAFTSDDGSGIGRTPGALGVAFLNSYANGTIADQTAWVFVGQFNQSFSGGSSGQIMATALEQGNTSAHEWGHVMGLEHYATSTGSAGPADVIPGAIMATPDIGLSRETWAAGISEAGTAQDDMAVISAAGNTFGYRTPDVSDAIGTPQLLLSAGGGIYTMSSIIGPITDLDYYSFVAAGGSTDIRVSVDDYVNDLDARVRVFDSTGTVLLGTNDPAGSFDAALTLNLSAGVTYIVEVASNGEAGEAGQYDLFIGPAGASGGGSGNGNLIMGLTKVGAGKIILKQDNNYGGVTDILDGILTIQDGGALGSPNSGTVVTAGAALEIDGAPAGGVTVDEFLTLNGTGVGATGGLRNVSGNNTWTGTITLKTDSSIGVDAATQLTVTGQVTDTSPAPIPPASLVPTDLTKVGTGALVFPNANPYTGNTYINEGILNIRNPNSLGVNTSAVQTVSVSGTSGSFKLTFDGFPSLLSNAMPFDVDAATMQTEINALLATPGSPGYVSGAVHGTVTVTTQANGSTFNVTFGGTLAAISVPMLYAPPSSFSTGQFDNTTAFTALILGGGQSRTYVADGATLQLQGGFSENSLKPAVVDGAGFGGIGALDSFSGANTWAATPVILADAASIGAQATASLAINQNITDRFQEQFIQFNGFSAGNQYTLTFNGITSPTIFYSGNPGTDAGRIQTALLGLSYINLYAGTVTVTSQGSNTFKVAFTGTMAGINWNAIQPTRLTGTGTFSAVTTQMTSNAYAVTKVGAGTVIFGSATSNAYTGLTTVNEGVLQLNKSSGAAAILGDLNVGNAAGAADSAELELLQSNQIADTSNVTIKSDGLFDLNDQTEVIDDVVMPGGHLVTGAGTHGAQNGDLTMASLDMSASANFTAGQAGAVVDVTGTADVVDSTVSVAGTMTIGGAATVTDSSVTNSGTITYEDTLTETDSTFTTSGITNVNGLFTMTCGKVDLTGTWNLGGDVVATSDTSSLPTPTISGAGTLNLGGTTRTFTVNHGAGATVTTDMAIDAIIAGSGSEGILKEGAGRLELGAANTYTGATTIHTGNVEVNGTIANAVLTGGTLSGVGTVGTIAGSSGAAVGTVDPGKNGPATAVIGTLTAQTTTFDSNTTFFVNITHTAAGSTPMVGVPGVDNDFLAVTGDIFLNGATIDGLVAANVVVDDEFTIIQTTGGTVQGTFNEPFVAGAVYLGGIKFNIDYSDNTKVVLRRVRATATVQIASSANPSVYGQAVTYTVTMDPEDGAGPVPTTTTVTFVFDGNSYGPVNVDSNGQATFNPQTAIGGPLSVGTHTLHVDYSGDANNFDPASGDLSPVQTVNKQAASVVVTSNPVVSASAPVYGQSVTINAAVSPSLASMVSGSANPTGTVTFVLDPGLPSEQTFSGIVISGGNAVLMPPTFPQTISVGSHTITATYNGDGNYLASTTPTSFTLTIQKNSTTASITPSAASTPLGQIVNFDVNVTRGFAGTTIGTPTGTLTFYDNNLSTPIGTRPYTGSTVTFPYDLFTVGAHNVIVVFTDTSGNFTDSPPAQTSITITKAPTTTTVLSFDPASPTYGTAVSFDITVFDTPDINAAFGNPSGSVTLWDGVIGTSPSDPTYLGTGSVDSITGSATLGHAGITTLPTALSQGTHTIYAVYSGDSNFLTSNNTSQAPAFTVTVGRANTTTVLSIAPGAGSVYGQTITLTAQVTSPAGALPIGSRVDFVDLTTSTPLGSGLLDATGKATLQTSALSVGTHTIEATYAANITTNFNTSSDTESGYVVGQSPTSVVVTANPANSASYGNQVTFTATVTGAAPGAGLPTNGTVFFTDSIDGPLGAGTFASGVFTYTTSSTQLSVNSNHVITATFSGDTNLQNQTGMLSGYVVTPAATTVSTPTSSASSGAVYGQPVTFTVNVSAIGGAPNPTSGAVVFRDGATILGTVNLAGTNTAQYTTTNTPSPQLGVTIPNTHAITATYQGSSPNYNASAASNAFSQIVTAAPTAITTFTSTTPTAPANAPANTSALGQQVVYSVVVQTQSPASVFPVNTGTVTFLDNGVAIGGPVAVNASGVATVAVTYSTAAQLGTHTIRATYNAPTANPINFQTSPQVSLTHNVQKNDVVTVAPLTTGNNYGLPLTYNGTVRATNPVPPGSGTPTGTVAVYQGATLLATSAAISASGTIGTANFSVTIPAFTLPVGSHALEFRYSGDTSPAPGFIPNLASITQVVNQAVTSIGLTSSSPIVSGFPQSTFSQSVTFTAVVTAASGGTPTTGAASYANGTPGANMVFTDNGFVIPGTVTLTGTTATTATYTLTTSALNASINPGHTIAASYSNGGNFADSTRSIVQKVAQAGTSTTVVSSSPIVSGAYQSSFGESVTFTAVVTAALGGTPTTGASSFANGVAGANIVFLDNGVAMTGTVTLTGTTATTATYSFTTSALAVSAGHTITASYSNGGNFANSSGSLTQRVIKSVTTTTLTSSSPVVGTNPQSNYGQTVTFTAVVTSATGGSPDFGPSTYDNQTMTSGVPINFYIANPSLFSGFLAMRGTVTRTGTTANSATYTISTAILPVASAPYQVQAYYLGNASHAATPVPQITFQQSAVVFQRVVAATTATTLVSSMPGGSSVGQPVTFTATVNVTSGGATGSPSPSGYARFNINSSFVGFGTLVGTTATSATYQFTTTTLPVGAHSVQVLFVTDNPNFAASNSNVVTQNVSQAQTITTLTSNPAMWPSDRTTTLTANVSYAPGHYAGSLITGGSVVFRDGATVIGTATVGVLPSPSATFVSFTLPTPYTFTGGAHTVTAEYHNSINTNIADSTGTQTQTVRRFSFISLTSNGSNVGIGSTVTYTVLFTDVVGAPIASRTITFTMNGQTLTRTTNAAGQATASFTYSTVGNYTVTASFLSDGIFNDATASITTSVTSTGRIVTGP